MMFQHRSSSNLLLILNWNQSSPSSLSLYVCAHKQDGCELDGAGHGNMMIFGKAVVES